MQWTTEQIKNGVRGLNRGSEYKMTEFHQLEGLAQHRDVCQILQMRTTLKKKKIKQLFFTHTSQTQAETDTLKTPPLPTSTPQKRLRNAQKQGMKKIKKFNFETKILTKHETGQLKYCYMEEGLDENQPVNHWFMCCPPPPLWPDVAEGPRFSLPLSHEVASLPSSSDCRQPQPNQQKPK